MWGCISEALFEDDDVDADEVDDEHGYDDGDVLFIQTADWDEVSRHFLSVEQRTTIP